MNLGMQIYIYNNKKYTILAVVLSIEIYLSVVLSMKI